MKIVVIGGGTGLSNLLRGLKKFSSELTAVVSVSDDGGSSGKLRQELGILPPGDVRNCLVALSQEETLMSRLFQYRFPDSGSLSGHSFGNLFITAMTALADGFDTAIARSGEVLAIRGTVLPVTLRSVSLKAVLSDGSTVRGESNISRSNAKIKSLSIEPSSPATPKVIQAIREADCIVIGPGSLYTSLICNLLIDGIKEEIKRNKCLKIYVSNIMTQPGETAGFSLQDHLRAIEKHSGKGYIDYVLFNSTPIPAETEKRYAAKGSVPVSNDMKSSKKPKISFGDLVSFDDNYIRHDPDKLAAAIHKLLKHA